MKTKILLSISMFLLFTGMNLRSEAPPAQENQTSLQGKFRISCPPELQFLADRWATEFGKLYPAAGIEIMVMPKGSQERPSGTGILLTSAHIPDPALLAQAWKLTVGREVFVPVVNAANPYMDDLSRKGISAAGLSELFQDPARRQWGSIVGSDQGNPVHIYMMNDISLQAAIGQFLGTETVSAPGIITGSAGEVISAVQKDPFALGFCKLADLQDPAREIMVQDIRLLPIDKNGNGRIDYMEKIYGDLNTFSRGVWIGKYPQALINDIYAVLPAMPEDETQAAFLGWILTGGQASLSQLGYCDLVNSERQSQLDKLSPATTILPPSGEAGSNPGLAWYILLSVVAVSLAITALIRRNRKKAMAVEPVRPIQPGAFSESTLNVPGGLYYDKSHTWAFMEKDGRVRLGIDDFLQHVTGPISRIELKKAGEKIKKGQPLLSIVQKGKQLTVYAPVSGTIREANQALLSHGDRINASPYANGWVYMIEPTDWPREIPLLQMAERYKKWLEEEFTRLKEFLAASLPANKIEMAHVVMQDGGELKDHILADLGPEVWEDFQSGFMDQYN